MQTTIDHARQPHPGAVRLRVVLEALAGSLASVQLDTLLACERDLAGVLAEIEYGGQAGWDRAATARELSAARAALMRCRRLGATLSDLARLSLVAQGRDAAYTRQAGVRVPATAHSLEARI